MSVDATDLLAAASRLLAEYGPEALTVRRIAHAAGCSTMAIYSHFGGKNGVVDGLFQEGFRTLIEALDRLWAVLGEDEDPIRRIQAMTRLYREIAHENATHYKIMLAHAVPNFAPAEESLEVGAQAFARLERGVAMAQGANRLDSSSSAEAIAHVLWATCHGMVSLELAAMVPPGVCAVQQYDRAVAAVLAGYRP